MTSSFHFPPAITTSWNLPCDDAPLFSLTVIEPAKTYAGREDLLISCFKRALSILALSAETSWGAARTYEHAERWQKRSVRERTRSFFISPPRKNLDRHFLTI